MINVIAVDPAGALYVAGRQGVYKSTDQGTTWKPSNEGLQSLNIRSLAISPADSSTIYVGTNGTGLYRSHDGGGSWEPLPLSITPGSR